MTYHDPVADLDPTMSNPKVQLIRRVKGILIGFELVTMVGLWVWGYQSGLEPYAALEDKPWFPIQEFLFFTLLMLLVMSITAIAFRAAEIRVTDNDSQKFVLANGSMKGAITTVVISLVLVLLVWWLPGSEQASSVLDEEKKGGGNNLSDLTYEFESQDVLLITETTTVTAQVTNNARAAQTMVTMEAIQKIPPSSPDSHPGIPSRKRPIPVAMAMMESREGIGDRCISIRSR